MLIKEVVARNFVISRRHSNNKKNEVKWCKLGSKKN